MCNHRRNLLTFELLIMNLIKSYNELHINPDGDWCTPFKMQDLSHTRQSLSFRKLQCFQSKHAYRCLHKAADSERSITIRGIAASFTCSLLTEMLTKLNKSQQSSACQAPSLLIRRSRCFSWGFGKVWSIISHSTDQATGRRS